MTKTEIKLIKKLDNLRFFLKNNDENIFCKTSGEEGENHGRISTNT